MAKNALLAKAVIAAVAAARFTRKAKNALVRRSRRARRRQPNSLLKNAQYLVARYLGTRCRAFSFCSWRLACRQKSRALKINVKKSRTRSNWIYLARVRQRVRRALGTTPIKNRLTSGDCRLH
jgi:hypothetical protein